MTRVKETFFFFYEKIKKKKKKKSNIYLDTIYWLPSADIAKRVQKGNESHRHSSKIIICFSFKLFLFCFLSYKLWSVLRFWQQICFSANICFASLSYKICQIVNVSLTWSNLICGWSMLTKLYLLPMDAWLQPHLFWSMSVWTLLILPLYVSTLWFSEIQWYVNLRLTHISLRKHAY